MKNCNDYLILNEKSILISKVHNKNKFTGYINDYISKTKKTSHIDKSFLMKKINIVKDTVETKLPKLNNSVQNIFDHTEMIKNLHVYENSDPGAFFQPKQILYSNKSKKNSKSVLQKSYSRLNFKPYYGNQKQLLGANTKIYKPSEFGEIYCDLVKDRH